MAAPRACSSGGSLWQVHLFPCRLAADENCRISRRRLPRQFHGRCHGRIMAGKLHRLIGAIGLGEVLLHAPLPRRRAKRSRGAVRP